MSNLTRLPLLVTLTVRCYAIQVVTSQSLFSLAALKMTRLRRRNCHTVLFAQVTCAWLFLQLLPVSAATQLPFSVPLRLSSGKIVEFSTRYYEVELVFPFEDQKQRAAARKLAGDSTRICKALGDCGATPSFLVTIKRGTDPVVREEKVPVGTNGFSATAFYRVILKTALKPGHYDIKVEVIYSPTELADYNAMIQFTTDARSSDLEN